MNSFTLPAKLYNFIKYLVLIVLPSFTTLYVLLATAWSWDDITKVSATLTGVTAFLGSLVGLSAKNFNNSDEKYYGEIHVQKTEEGAIIDHQVFNDDPNGGTLADKKEITLRVVQT